MFYSNSTINQSNKLFSPRKNPNLLIIILLIFSFIFGIIFGLTNSDTISSYIFKGQGGKVLNQEEAAKYKNVDFQLIFQLWQLIKDDYLDKAEVTESQLFYGAMTGSVASLNDPYSIFLNPTQAKEFEQELAGNFEGIGAEIGVKNNVLTIISALPNSPAQKAGLRSKDQILAIDNFDTASLTLDQAIGLIRGKSGTVVSLIIKRPAETELIEFKITRAKIEITSVEWQILKNNIAYLKISNFNQETINKFKIAVNNILLNNPKGIILDLRNNPGGYLDTAIEIASYWVEEGAIVEEDYRDPAKNIKYYARGSAKLKEIKTVALVNGGAASASEIIAGALQDYQLATIVGEKTFGKGTIQDLKALADGSAVKLTIAHWLTPNGQSIEENGITPDIEVELTKADYDNDQDPQLDKAIEILSR